MDKTIKRKDWIDFARAIGIFAIVYGHLVLGNSIVSQYYGSFRVAIFFCVMGLTFRCDEDFMVFLKKKAKRLLIPYACFASASIIVMSIVQIFFPSLVDGKQNGLINNIIGALYANGLTGNMNWNLPLWFLPCAFVSLVLVYLIERIFQFFPKTNVLVLRLVYIALSIVLNYLYCRYIRLLKLPFGTEVAISMTGFIELGILLRNLDRFKNKFVLGLVGILFSVLSFLLSLNNGEVSVMSLNFGHSLIIYYIVAVTAIVGIFLLAICLCPLEFFRGIIRVICYCGIHTLAILCMHKFPIIVFQYFLPITKSCFRLSEDNAIKNILGFIVAFIVIAICLVVELPINRFIPQVFGNNKTKALKLSNGVES